MSSIAPISHLHAAISRADRITVPNVIKRSISLATRFLCTLRHGQEIMSEVRKSASPQGQLLLVLHRFCHKIEWIRCVQNFTTD